MAQMAELEEKKGLEFYSLKDKEEFKRRQSDNKQAQEKHRIDYQAKYNKAQQVNHFLNDFTFSVLITNGQAKTQYDTGMHSLEEFERQKGLKVTHKYKRFIYAKLF